MKRKIFVTLLTALLLVLSLSFTACSKPTPSIKPDPEISIDVTEARLDVYESLQLTAATANTDASVEWSSSDVSIATVDGGLVTACAEGTATIAAKAGDVSAFCTVTVYNSWTAPILVVDQSKISVAKNGSYTVTAKTRWKGNDVTSGVEYSWVLGEGENDAIAELEASGNKATFTGKEYGNTEFVVFTTVYGVPLVHTVSVKVCNADIYFDVSNLEKGVGGYSARLALLKLDDTDVDVIPQITVFDANGAVDGATAQMEWRVEGDSQSVTRDESTGKISAVSEGEAKVIGSYENSDLVINVTVYRPQINLDDTVYFETSKLFPKTKGVFDPNKTAESGVALQGLQGNVTGAKFDGADIFDSFNVDNNIIELKKTNLNTDKKSLGETRTLRVDTDKAIYRLNAKVVTLAIRTPEDLDSIAEVSADESTYWALKNESDTEYAPYYWDGYYVLANDIDYTGDREGREFVTFIDWNSLSIVKNPDHTDADWVDGRCFGFRGTFDGQGYNISNFKLKNVDTGGIFGVMATDGVFRNVSFTNAVNPGGTGLICSAGDGTIENVYIQCSSQTGGWNNNRSGMFYTRDIINTAAVKNVFVDTRLTYNASNTAGDGWIYAFGYAYPSSANYRGVYCVGTEKAYAEKYQGGSWVDNIYGAYNTYTDLRNGGVNFDEWTGDFWQIANGLPYPKNLEIPEVDTTSNKTVINKQSTAGVETVTVTTDKYAVVTLDAQSILAGVRLKGIEQANSDIQKLEFIPVNEARTVTFTVRSAFDPTDVGTRYQVQLSRKLEPDNDVEMNFENVKVIYVSGQPITLADISDEENFVGVDFEKLTVTCNNEVVACTLNGNLLQFTPTTAGTYDLLYTHLNGNKVKTASQTVRVCATREEYSSKYENGEKVSENGGSTVKTVTMSELDGKALHFEFKFMGSTGKFEFAFMDREHNWANIVGDLVITKHSDGTITTDKGIITEVSDGWYAWELNRTEFNGDGVQNAVQVDMVYHQGKTVQGGVYIDWDSLRAADEYSFFASHSKIDWQITSGNAMMSPTASTIENSSALQLTNVSDSEWTIMVLTIDPAMTARIATAKKLSMRLKLERNVAARNLTFNFRIGTWKDVENVGEQHDVWAKMGDNIVDGYSDNVALDKWHTIDFFREAPWGDSLTPLSQNGGKIFVQIEVKNNNAGDNLGYRLVIDDISIALYDHVLDFEMENEAEIYARSYDSGRISTAEVVEGEANSGSKAIKVFQNQYGALVIKIPDDMKAKIANDSKLTVRFMLADVKTGSGESVENPAAHTFAFYACSKPTSELDNWKDGLINGNDWLADCQKGTWYQKTLSSDLLTKVKDNGYLWIEVEIKEWQEYEFYVDFVTLG